MSSAFYPLGMNQYNNRLPQGGYVSWKGTGLSSVPVGITAGTIRPLTNKDPGNYFPAAFGKPRPIKHARKGAIPHVSIQYADSYEEYITMDRNINREVKSSSLGTLVKQMIDNPGSYSVKQNTLYPEPNDKSGICVSATYYPNIPYLTENPEPYTTSPQFCCNDEKKARRRVLPASTNLKQNYYTTLQQYRENRCQTYEQRAFNFVRPAIPSDPNAKPGDPLSIFNTYVANCQPNGDIYQTSEANLVSVIIQIMENQNIISSGPAAVLYYRQIQTFQQLVQFIAQLPQPNQNQAIVVYDAFILNPYSGVPITGPSNPAGCKLVVYKPNNYQFAQQGGVTASTLTLKLNVTTIEKNLAHLPKSIVLKNKAPKCDPGIVTHNQLFSRSGLGNGNPRTCHAPTNDIKDPSNSVFDI